MKPIQLILKNDSDATKIATIFGDSDIEVKSTQINYDYEKIKNEVAKTNGVEISLIRIDWFSEKFNKKNYNKYKNSKLRIFDKEGNQLCQFILGQIFDVNGMPYYITDVPVCGECPINKVFIQIDVPAKYTYTMTIFFQDAFKKDIFRQIKTYNQKQ